MYKSLFTSAFLKRFKKLDHMVRKVFYDSWLHEILENPFEAGNHIKSSDHFYVYKTRFNKCDYRITYQVQKMKVIVFFVSIGTRENFYL